MQEQSPSGSSPQKELPQFPEQTLVESLKTPDCSSYLIIVAPLSQSLAPSLDHGWNSLEATIVYTRSGIRSEGTALLGMSLVPERDGSPRWSLTFKTLSWSILRRLILDFFPSW